MASECRAASACLTRMCSSARSPGPRHVAAATLTPASLIAAATLASAPGVFSTSMTRSTMCPSGGQPTSHHMIEITHFTDPACPFAFSAEPARLRLRWHYGDGLRWRTTMIVLTREPGEAEKLAEGAPGLQRRYGMPIDPRPYARPASSEPAGRAFVAARRHAPDRAEALLRRLRVRVMLGALLDDPALIDAAAADAGLDPAALATWCASDDVAAALE